MKQKVDKNFVSDVDKELEQLRKTVPENDSQRRERLKYEKINKLRDDVQEESDKSELWEDF